MNWFACSALAKFLKLEANGRGYEQLSVACAMGRIAYSLCYVGVLACV
jgi:hypothetical protein